VRRSADRIVVGYDGSDCAKRALDRAAALAGYGSQVTVVHVASDPLGLDKGKLLLTEARDRLVAQQVFARTFEPVGDPAEQLIEAARELEADLVIVGNGKGPLARLVLGSVSTKVVHRAPCDVLVVR
jgi:nucleotide-binding universal stress UspA family protein